MINNITKTQTANYTTIQPILEALRTSNDKLPQNSLPIDLMGTIQQNAEEASHPTLTIYNAHGVVTPENPNTLLARV